MLEEFTKELNTRLKELEKLRKENEKLTTQLDELVNENEILVNGMREFQTWTIYNTEDYSFDVGRKAVYEYVANRAGEILELIKNR